MIQAINGLRRAIFSSSARHGPRDDTAASATGHTARPPELASSPTANTPLPRCAASQSDEQRKALGAAIKPDLLVHSREPTARGNAHAHRGEVNRLRHEHSLYRHNNRKISPPNEHDAPHSLHPEDVRFDPTSPTSFDSSWRDLAAPSCPNRGSFWLI
jgi:hypothetical protein